MAEFISFPPNNIGNILEKLSDKTPSLWGIMTAHHMLEHLLLPLEFSQGKFSVPLVTAEDKVEKVKRIALLSDAPLRRDFVAPFLGPGLQPFKFQTFNESKTALLNEIESYLTFWESNENAVFTHPIFGPLNREEWHLFHRKHFTHHFSQFGLL